MFATITTILAPERPPSYGSCQPDSGVLILIERTHGERFIALLQRHYPTWREARAELNELPLAPYR